MCCNTFRKFHSKAKKYITTKEMEIQTMRKLIAMVLVLALAAAAFCFEAFASSYYPLDFDEGTVNGTHWIARISSTEATVRSTLSWQGERSGKNELSGKYVDDYDGYHFFKRSSTGNGKPVAFTVPRPNRQWIWDAISICSIQGRVVCEVSTRYMY